jgi:hypothetical protein
MKNEQRAAFLRCEDVFIVVVEKNALPTVGQQVDFMPNYSCPDLPQAVLLHNNQLAAISRLLFYNNPIVPHTCFMRPA